MGNLWTLLDQLMRHLDDEYSEHLIDTLQQQQGLGLGIALMVRVARLHGGLVAFGNRQAGAGAWVQFRLPAQTTERTVVAGGVQARLSPVAA